jgi:enoyl-CoA hydratase/carnithine racemase
MAALIQAKLSPRVAHEAMTTGRRYGGADAAAAQIVDVAVDEAEVLPQALGHAQRIGGKHAPTLGTIKTQMYGGAAALLRRQDAR